MLAKNTRLADLTPRALAWIQAERDDPAAPPLRLTQAGPDLEILRHDGSPLSPREEAGCAGRLAAWEAGGRR